MPMPRVSFARAGAASWVLPASLMLVAAVSPFERALPGSPFGFTLTTVELTIVIALALGALAWIKAPASFAWRTPITMPLAAIVAWAVFFAIAAACVEVHAFPLAAIPRA